VIEQTPKLYMYDCQGHASSDSIYLLGFSMTSFLPFVQQSPHIFQKGRFHSIEELDGYETMWHEHIFTECYSTVHDEVSGYAFCL